MSYRPHDLSKWTVLSKQETDAIVDELCKRERITKMPGIKIMLSPNEKKILDSEWRQVE